ncbi:DUF2917 domain-containing protein [Paraherbaspirillum soli]|uniref:DUF2917 domain-containing protein n=1 Tax=Paraherbaspirillum soli TaxID=631222 RepID=A0ABW0M9K9_9BURK
MQTGHTQLTIAGGCTLAGIADSPRTLRVLSGQVWITFEGQPEDHWLRAGRSLALLPGRMVVVESDSADSRIELTCPPQRGLLTALLSALSRLRDPGFHPATNVFGLDRVDS